MPGVVIVGASAAGLSAAEALREAGCDRPITLIGAEPHLPYDRPPLSKQVLLGQWDADRTVLRTCDQLAGLDLRLSTEAVALDPDSREITLVDGEHIGYEHLIIATGAQPRRLPGDGQEGVHYLRTLDDALALRDRLTAESRLVAIGAGFVGSEIAAAARAIGAHVTLIGQGPAPMSEVLGPVLGGLMARTHADHGVTLLMRAEVAALLPEGTRVGGVVLTDGRTVPADLVVVGIGSVPSSGWLTGSGLPVDSGVLCDRYGSAGPGVSAAGDVAAWYQPVLGSQVRIEHRTSATQQARCVAHNLLGGRTEPGIPYFWTDQYGLRLQVWGYPTGDAAFAVVEGDLEDRRFLAVYGRAGRVIGVAGMGLPRQFREARALIGTPMLTKKG
ncbi:NAD(P)/FAD-dependent oxidoreductase [Nonomuraea sp. KM88]|uniref:NAD(P)/FAD-dependent oxidoreductase n=1 Tax=Nonomuraea sp. KM88 TaxID=3457427 RepID=UPI003FCE7BE6